MHDIRVFKSCAFAIALVTVGVVQGVTVAPSVVNPLFIQQVHGYNATASGLVALPSSALGAIAGFVAGGLFDRYGVRRTAWPGIIASFAAVVGLACMGSGFSIIGHAALMVPFGVSLQFVFTPINTWGVNALTNRVIQHATALNAVFIQIFVSLVTALVIAIGALAPSIAPGADAHELLYLSDHIAYIALAVITSILTLTTLLNVR